MFFDCERAHSYSSNNRPQLEKDTRCGCFYCGKIFSPKEITCWYTDESSPTDCLGTAVCPYCGIDSVIGESSGFAITEDFLEAMNRKWF